MLSSSTYCRDHCDYAETLLNLFVDHFGSLYGQKQVLYNVHALTHLASHSRRFGHIHVFSGVPFENYLQTIKQLANVRKPKFPLPQVIRRLSEKMHSHKPHKAPHTICKKSHKLGPLTQGIGLATQYGEIHLPGYMLLIWKPDNVVLIGSNTYIIRNIIIHNNLKKSICSKFQTKDSLFVYPFDARKLNIASVSNIRDDLEQFDSREISAKSSFTALQRRVHFNSNAGLSVYWSCWSWWMCYLI